MDKLADANSAGLAPEVFRERLDTVLQAVGMKASDLAPYGFRADVISRWRAKQPPKGPGLRHLELALGLPLGAFEWNAEAWGVLLNVLSALAVERRQGDPVEMMLAGAAALLDQARRSRSRAVSYLLDALARGAVLKDPADLPSVVEDAGNRRKA